MNDLIAIDVAVPVPRSIANVAGELNRVLAGTHKQALRLDSTHLPHVTLAQQFVERPRLAELLEVLDPLVRHEPAIFLRVSGGALERGTASLVVERTVDLQRLHEQIMDALEPFESPEGGAWAFQRDGEAIRRRDVAWVRNYREQAAYVHFRPHVTVGHAASAAEAAGLTTATIEPIEDYGERLAVCHLGRFCTCRTVLREWRLPAPPGR